MSYSMKQIDSDFGIEIKHYKSACAALKKALVEQMYVDYVNIESVVKFCDNLDLPGAMQECRWCCSHDNNGINGIEFSESKSGMDDLIFCAIAPFVDEDSFILMRGDDGTVWRWRFNDGKCTEENAEYVYPSDPIYAVILDFVHDGECGVECLCITRDFEKAKKVMNEKIMSEKSNTWISKVESEDIGKDNIFVEEKSDISWSFYQNGYYSLEHTDIKIFEENENEDK